MNYRISLLYLYIIFIYTTFAEEVPPTPKPRLLRWEQCTNVDEGYAIMKGLSIDPYPLLTSSVATMKYEGFTNKIISGGKFEVLFYAGSVKLKTFEIDFCKKEGQKNPGLLECPIDIGSFTIEHTFEIPFYVPARKYAVKLQGIDPLKRIIFCVDSEIEVQRPSRKKTEL